MSSSDNHFKQLMQKRLLSAEKAHLQRELDLAIAHFCGTHTVFLGDERETFPRFGVFSELAAVTPMRVYDLPELTRACNTAFTDGARIFFCASFFEELIEESRKKKISLEFLIAHELEHIRNLHVERSNLSSIPHGTKNIAQDIRINIDILETFTGARLLAGAKSRSEFNSILTTKFSEGYRETIDHHSGRIVHSGYGTKLEDRQKWKDASSEQIAKILHAAEAEKPKLDLSDLMKKVAQDMRNMADKAQQSDPTSTGEPGPSGASDAAQQDASSQAGNSGNPSPSQAGSDGQSGGAASQSGMSEASAGGSSAGGASAGRSSSSDPGQSGSPSSSGGAPSAGTEGQGSPGSGAGTPSPEQLRELADALDRVANGKGTRSDLEKIAEQTKAVAGSEAMRDLDLDHKPSNESPKKAEDIRPSVRAQMAAEAAKQLANGQPQHGQSCESAGNNGKNSKGKGQKGDGASPSDGQGGEGNTADGSGPGQDGNGNPDKNGNLDPDGYESPSDNHYIPPENLKDILERADAHNLSKSLGYDTPASIDKMKKDAAINAEAAVRKAAQEVGRLGGNYPGAHCVDAAMRDIQNFTKPVLDWKLKFKKVLTQAAGRKKMGYSLLDPWMQYGTPHQDMGFNSADDVPYMGSHVPYKPKKNIVLVLIDTSGSTSDILLSLTSEALGMARKNRRDNSPDVLVCFADTVVRGKPVVVTERDLKRILESGIDAGGGGGTDFTVPLISAANSVKKGGAFQGRTIDHIVYFTDGECWLPPRDALPEKMPPVLFVVPQSRYRLDFENEAKRSGWADAVFYDPQHVKTIDLERSASSARKIRP